MSKRSYAVGVVAVATIDEDGFVIVEVDTSEMSDINPDLAILDKGEEAPSDEQIAADSELLSQWSSLHTIINEGYVK